MTHLYNQPSMARLLTSEECSKLAQGRTLRSALASPIELQTAFPPRKPEAQPSEVYYNDDGARIHAVDPDSLIPRRSLSLHPLNNRARFDLAPASSTTQSILTHRPGRASWNEPQDIGYETAPSSVAHSTPVRGEHAGVLDGIASAYQRFPGSDRWGTP